MNLIRMIYEETKREREREGREDKLDSSITTIII